MHAGTHFQVVVLSAFFQLFLGHHCCTLHGTTYILQVIVLWLASHKH